MKINDNKNIVSSQKLPKAVSEANINIGNIVIHCAILEDGSQVIPRNSILKLMGRSNPGGRPTKEILRLRSCGVQIPVFIAANNLIPFIPNTLSMTCTPIMYTRTNGGKISGFKANIIPDICDTYLEARKNNVLTKDQLPIADTLEIISRGLSRVGIAGLINEACGIITNEKDYLQKILKDYISKCLLPYIKRFPKTFFENYKRIYDISNEGFIPPHIGHFINNFIYKELSPGILEKLKEINPVKENGRRLYAHHRFLTVDKGIIELDKQILKVNTLLCLSNNKQEFIDLYNKVC